MQKRYLEFADRAGGSAVGEDLCVVLDVSPSMEYDDFEPSRLDGARRALRELLAVKCETYPDDQVGIVTFDENARVVCPLTPARTGRASLEQAVRKLETRSCTNITAGLTEAGRVLGRESDLTRALKKGVRWLGKALLEPSRSTPAIRTRRILLLGDGAHNTGPGPEAVASQLKRDGVVIDVIGISGDARGEREFDEEQLKRIASRRADGSIRYCFISDTAGLIKTFGKMAHRIRPLKAGA